MIHCKKRQHAADQSIAGTYPMRGIRKHTQGVDGIRLERAVEHQESGEVKVALHVVSRDMINLVDSISASTFVETSCLTLSAVKDMVLIPKARTRLPRLV